MADGPGEGEEIVSTIKVGVIGCGYWGPKLARNFHDLPDTCLAWVADRQPERLAHMRSLYPDVHTTQQHTDILNSDVDAVIIATPCRLTTFWPCRPCVPASMCWSKSR
jgi:predicted dehydrogenase